MREDIYKMIRENPAGEVLATLMVRPILKLDLYDKFLIYSKWESIGSPSGFKGTLDFYINEEELDIVSNYQLRKLKLAPLESLLTNLSSYNLLEDKKYNEITQKIFSVKLSELEKTVSRKGFQLAENKEVYGNTSIAKYVLKGVTVVYDLFRLELVIRGYKFEPVVKILNSIDGVNDMITEQSIKNLKALMYSMTENPDWDLTVLDRGIEALTFKQNILNNLKVAMLEKYGKQPDKPEELSQELKDLFGEDDLDNIFGRTSSEDDE